MSRGVELFNGGEYFEAHEAFEDEWRAASGDRKTALQALTQLAAAFHKIETHGPGARGAKYLLEKSREKLAAHGALLGPLGASALAQIDAALPALARAERPPRPRLG